jgi:hypothetical protein
MGMKRARFVDVVGGRHWRQREVLTWLFYKLKLKWVEISKSEKEEKVIW